MLSKTPLNHIELSNHYESYEFINSDYINGDGLISGNLTLIGSFDTNMLSSITGITGTLDLSAYDNINIHCFRNLKSVTTLYLNNNLELNLFESLVECHSVKRYNFRDSHIMKLILFLSNSTLGTIYSIDLLKSILKLGLNNDQLSYVRKLINGNELMVHCFNGYGII